jgi:chemotaxis protein methyltransferase CheR
MDDRDFRRLLKELGLSWRGYRRVRKGVKKRIGRHMGQGGFETLDAYLEGLKRDDRLMNECRRLMTVSISRFFRDRNLWKLLQEEILPGLSALNATGLKVWSAGCASGEEVYSLKIVRGTLKEAMGSLPDLQVLATDMNPDYLLRAKTGLYPESSLKELEQSLKSKYFQYIEKEAFYRINDQLRVGIEWRVHHLLSDSPPAPCFQLIFLRNNLLTYYEEGSAVEGLRRVISTLDGGGFLIIGANEHLPAEAIGLLRPHPRFRYVFQKPLQRPECDVKASSCRRCLQPPDLDFV